MFGFLQQGKHDQLLDDVAGKLQQIRIIFDDNALTASLKQMVASKMATIEPLGVGGAEPVHGLFQNRFS
jgi:hypothetical protein